MLLSKAGRLSLLWCGAMLLCCLVLTGCRGRDTGTTGGVTSAELDAFEADLNARVGQEMGAIEVLRDEPNAKELLLAGLRERPTSQPWATYVRSLFALDESQADGLTGEARLKHYQEWLDYLAQARHAVTSALEKAPGDVQLQRQLMRLNQPLTLVALETGDTKTARQYAEEWLQSNTDTQSYDYGNIIHDANEILGRVALREGNVAEAKRFLIEAGKTPGSPQLNSFGPQMTLARELLEKGEKDVVIEYLDLVAKFWASPETETNDLSRQLAQEHAALLQQWKSDIEAGRTPAGAPGRRQWR